LKHKKLVISAKSDLTLKACMQAIDQNQMGFIMVVEGNNTPVGILTDGDIRACLLKGATLDDPALKHLNRKFVSAQKNVSRENILKLFDSSIRLVPILDGTTLRDIVTLNDVRYDESTGITARAKAPARISFGGGGTDLTPFFLEHGGAVLNATISLYSRATIKRRSDKAIVIRSLDFDQTVTADGLSALKYDGNLDLLKAPLRLLKPEFGLELEVSSDFPPSSGLGGSSVVLASVIGCLNQFRSDNLDSYDIAELAFQAERIELKCAGGWQDQYAAVFGGFNFMEFRRDRNEINSLRVPESAVNELEERMILCFTGRAHPVQKIHDKQKKRMVDEAHITEYAKRTRDIAYEMKAHLLRGEIDALGDLLHEGWTMKKTFSEDISDPEIDQLYDFARENGAVGGKLLGAGGGGFFLFQAGRDSRHNLIKALAAKNFTLREFNFDEKGLRNWITKK